jgi:integrase
MSGRVYRRCTCRDENGKELGPRCPDLGSDSRHGKWGYAVDVPTVDGRRKTMRRHRWSTKRAAQAALDDVRDRYGQGVEVNDSQLTADWLRLFLHDRRWKFKPKTLHSYTAMVDNYLVPKLGAIPLERLRHTHVSALIDEMEAEGRGAPTIRRTVAVLSSALSYAVAQRRLTHNVAKHAPLPPEGRKTQEPWTAAEAIRFLEHVADHRLSSLFEVLIGCGLRRGEALALRWQDVDMETRVLHVRQNMTDIDGRIAFGTPKTKGSAAGVGLSSRVVRALRTQRERQAAERAEWADAYEDHDLVFARENGMPLRPEWVLDTFHRQAAQAGLRQIRLHGLRHLAATLMLSNGVPLALVSKTLRHSKLGITADLYSHLTHEASVAAADALGSVLDAVASERAAIQKAKDATALRPQAEIPAPTRTARDSVSAGQGVDASGGWSGRPAGTP